MTSTREKLSRYKTTFFTFLAITLFYAFESAQMAYYNVLAPAYLSHGGYQQSSIAAISAAYFYGTMVGLFPMGHLLDHFPLRKSILMGITGSVGGVLLLSMTHNFYLQWSARFICGFFGGTTCFLGGIRIIALVFPARFSYFLGIFLAAGMFGGMICQYPLLMVVKHFGPTNAIRTVLIISILVLIFSYVYLRPSQQVASSHENNIYPGSFWEMCKEIVLNARNWCDVLMVSLLDTPVSIIGTLWGVVFLTNFFHFSEGVSSLIVMALFLGLMLGLPVLGHIADKFDNPPRVIIIGAAMSLFIILVVVKLQGSHDVWLIATLFFGLGFFSSCQTMGFTWITQGMRKELIGRNSAFNSMVFMGTNGAFKQLGAFLLGIPALLMGNGSAANLMLTLAVAMLIATIYVTCRKFIFQVKH